MISTCMGDSGVGTKDLYAGHQYGYFDLGIYRRTVVPKLGAMPPPQGAMGLLPGSHGRILNKYICQGLILKNGLFEFLEIFTH